MDKRRIIFFVFVCLFVSGRLGRASGTSEGIASWYSVEACHYNPDPSCPTASGKSLYALESQSIDFAASWNYSLGTKIRVTNISNGKSVEVIILDRGPSKKLKDRIIDLSKSAFFKIANPKRGLCRVKVTRS